MTTFHPVFKSRDNLINKRQTILKMARELNLKYFTAWDVSDAIFNATGGEILIDPSLCDLVLRRAYDRLPGLASFSREPLKYVD